MCVRVRGLSVFTDKTRFVRRNECLTGEPTNRDAIANRIRATRRSVSGFKPRLNRSTRWRNLCSFSSPERQQLGAEHRCCCKVGTRVWQGRHWARCFSCTMAVIFGRQKGTIAHEHPMLLIDLSSRSPMEAPHREAVICSLGDERAGWNAAALLYPSASRSRASGARWGRS